MKTTRLAIVMSIVTAVILCFLIMPGPVQAYQNIHTLTSTDSVSTALRQNLAGQTLYLHAKAPESGALSTRVHAAHIIEFSCGGYNGECRETQGSFPSNHLTYYHTTVTPSYVSGTGIGMLTDSPKAKIADCDTGQHH